MTSKMVVIVYEAIFKGSRLASRSRALGDKAGSGETPVAHHP
jgi:hypothetical protein